jgi:hypothetical protein
MELEAWVKPSGVEVWINAESRGVAKELGWVPKSPDLKSPVVEPKRRGPSAKTERGLNGYCRASRKGITASYPCASV